jgi:hypothetical protein
MTNAEFHAAVKAVYPRAAEGCRKAVAELGRLMALRKRRTCACGCGRSVPNNRRWFSTGLCWRRFRYYTRKLAPASACLLAVTLYAAPPMPPAPTPRPLRPPIEATRTLAWDPSDTADADGVAGYKLWWGGAVRQYTNCLDVGTNLSAAVDFGYTRARPVHFAVTAYSTNGLESEFSDEVQFPRAQTNWVEVGVALSESPMADGRWTEITNVTLLRRVAPAGSMFYRARPIIRQRIEN